MKTAVSLPDDLFAEAEHLAQRLKWSRSRLYADAVREYVARHNPDAVTETLNRVCNLVDDSLDPAIAAAGKRLLDRVEW